MKEIIICGAAPCLEVDLSRIPNPEQWDFLAVGLDAIGRIPHPIAYLATYHPEDIPACRERRAVMGGNLDYKVIGMLPGEKLAEILVSEEELLRVESLGDYYKILPWWDKRTPHQLGREYSSDENLIGHAAIAGLIARADREFEALEMVGGEFAKF